ncbi:hypothetical protein, partial [Xanthomonas perforans]
LPRSSSKQHLQHGSFGCRVAGKEKVGESRPFSLSACWPGSDWRGNALADAKRKMKKIGACPTHNAASGGCVRKSHRRHDRGLANRLS